MTMVADLVDPRGLTVLDWTDSMVFPLIDSVRPPKLENPEAWQSWALEVIQAPGIAQLNPPDPRFQDDWREWAIRFNETVSQT